MRPSTRHFTWTLGVVMIAVITVGHYLTPTSSPQFHDALRRLYYLPIVWLGVRSGLAGGLFGGLLAAAAYYPHIHTHWGGHPLGEANLNRTFEMMLWVLVGVLTGYLSDRERAARRAAETARDEALTRAREASESACSLLEAQEQLRHADRLSTLGLLSAGLAHEIRNPLGSLRGIGDMLRVEFPEGHPRRELLEILEDEVQRLDKVVCTFLDSARPEEGEGPGEVASAFQAVHALLSWECAQRNTELAADLVPGDSRVPVPEGQLRQILVNLILNALHAAGKEGSSITVVARRVRGAVELRVDDEGPGFPAPYLREGPRPFLTTRDGGTGLGLPITKRLVEAHGGTFEIENPECGGATVRMTFPGEDA